MVTLSFYSFVIMLRSSTLRFLPLSILFLSSSRYSFLLSMIYAVLHTYESRAKGVTLALPSAVMVLR